MAANSKLEHSYSSPLPKEFLLPLAAQINRVPLPILPESYGIRLPHERDRLTAINWDLAPVTERRTYPEEVSDARDDGASGSTSQANPAAGPGGVNGSHTGASGMDLDMAGDNLFGGRGDEDEDEDDEDDDDDEDMEEVVDTSLQQTDRAQSKDQEDADADEDAEEDDAEEEEDDDDDNGDDDDDDDDAEGQDDS
jgi:transcription initiation factor TFIID subunit 9B